MKAEVYRKVGYSFVRSPVVDRGFHTAGVVAHACKVIIHRNGGLLWDLDRAS